MTAALMVGVSGVRGIVGDSLTPAIVLEFAQAYGTLLEGGRVILARDSRTSGEMFLNAAAAGLIAAGCEVTQIGIAMTPSVGFALRDGTFAGGVSITASHNPAPWNGVKFLDDRGLAPDPAKAASIAAIRDERRQRHVLSGFQALRSDTTAGERHADAVQGAVEVDLSPLRGKSVVLDCVNGAGGVVTPEFLSELGLQVHTLNGEPNGEFAHAPEPLAENLGDLCSAVRAAGAVVGFAQDPDADRLAIVDEQGRYIGEEYTLALSALARLQQKPGPLAANLSTSRLIDAVAQRFGVDVHRTPVGEAHVARAVLDHGCVLGGEGNGGVIDPRFSPVRDSLAAMSLILQLLASTGKPLSVIVSELPRLAMVKQKAECPRARIDAAVAAVRRVFASERINAADGVRIDFAEGWVHLRASNTEPIVRIIAEAEHDAAAARLIARVRQAAEL